MIAVIAAMDLEVTAITEIMDRVCKHTHSGIDFMREVSMIKSFSL